MKIRRGFRVRWFSVTIVGFLVSLLFVEVGEKPDIGVLEGVIGGAAIGLAQWFVLRQYFSPALGWVLASIAAWGLVGGSGFGALGWVAPKTTYIHLRIIFGTLDGAIVGALIGVAQWLVLKKQVESAWRWIVASTVGWSLGLSLGWSLGGVLHWVTGAFLGEVIGLVWSWVVVATITGFTLIGLLSEQIPD